MKEKTRAEEAKLAARKATILTVHRGADDDEP